MNIENEIFNRYHSSKDKLLKYGFKEANNTLIFTKSILNNTFKVIIEYNKVIKGKIIDLSFNDEYTNFRRETTGIFNQQIKDEFINILLDIKDKCFIKQLFIYNQSNRINNYIKNTYNISPEFLWDKYPNYAVYKNNKKWFSIIMDIPQNKLDKKLKDNSITEIINVKINPCTKDNLLKINGIYESYHMNKKNWVSIRLDDTLPDQKIYELINNSYSIISN